MVHIKRQVLALIADSTIRHAIYDRMQNEHIAVCCLTSPVVALANYIKQDYCLVMLDCQFAMANGMELLRTIQNTKHVPILIFTASLSPKEKVALFHAGADACVEKPLDIDVCVAQAKALIQLYTETNTYPRNYDIISFGSELVISPRFRQVFVEGKALVLTKKEFDLLHFFAKAPRQVFTRAQLYDHVWDGEPTVGVDEIVKTHIKTLRKKLAFTGKKYIHTVWGSGYKFVLENTEQ